MINFKVTLLLAAVVLTASFGYAQNAKDSTVSREKPIPEPWVLVGNIPGGGISKDSLLENPFLKVAMPSDFDGEIEWNVLSYKVVFVDYTSGNGVESPPITVKEARFSDEVISKIQSAPSGTMVEFSEIRIQSIAGTRLIVRPIMLRIE